MRSATIYSISLSQWGKLASKHICERLANYRIFFWIFNLHLWQKEASSIIIDILSFCLENEYYPHTRYKVSYNYSIVTINIKLWLIIDSMWMHTDIVLETSEELRSKLHHSGDSNELDFTITLKHCRQTGDCFWLMWPGSVTHWSKHLEQ